ncbi:hypothetical protein K435DRAFT_964280 [Dendrothele bispora CBS 962.96]|uniref:Uncharacterized protein n=1 Tax=Dendrothele bispora (strain CBS 962.96) TaxID=1314807 RepID=A0A4S8MBM6_DENBC|nr:hypothetical protein K435DRAFT_964280 [Dendrothele bispora CBS 962.96]
MSGRVAIALLVCIPSRRLSSPASPLRSDRFACLYSKPSPLLTRFPTSHAMGGVTSLTALPSNPSLALPPADSSILSNDKEILLANFPYSTTDIYFLFNGSKERKALGTGRERSNSKFSIPTSSERHSYPQRHVFKSILIGFKQDTGGESTRSSPSQATGPNLDVLIDIRVTKLKEKRVAASSLSSSENLTDQNQFCSFLSMLSTRPSHDSGRNVRCFLLSAGSIDTRAILLLSGTGPNKELGQVGVELSFGFSYGAPPIPPVASTITRRFVTPFISLIPSDRLPNYDERKDLELFSAILESAHIGPLFTKLSPSSSIAASNIECCDSSIPNDIKRPAKPHYTAVVVPKLEESKAIQQSFREVDAFLS